MSDTTNSRDTPPPNVPDVTEPLQDQPKRNGIRQEYSAEALTRLQQNMVKVVDLMGVPIIALVIDGMERLCLAQISNTLLKQYSYNEVHNRRVALGINCVQCTPVQLEILRRAGAMPVSSRRCGMITKREAERLCKSFLSDSAPPKLPDDFSFYVYHKCAWGCKGVFVPSRYNSSRAKCIQCNHCRMYFSPNKFIFHSHRFSDSSYLQPDAANFNNWRRHLHLVDTSKLSESLMAAWEDVKAMFNGGTRKRFLTSVVIGTATHGHTSKSSSSLSSHVGAPSTKVVKQQHAAGGDSPMVSYSISSSTGGNNSPPFASAVSFPPIQTAIKAPLDTRSTAPWFFNPYAAAAAAAFGNTFQHNRFLPGAFPLLSPSQLMVSSAVSLMNSEMMTSTQRFDSNNLIMPITRNDSVQANNMAKDSMTSTVGSSSGSRGSETPPSFTTPKNQDTPVQAHDAEVPKRSYQSLSKEELQELLVGEIEARRRLEQDLNVLKDTVIGRVQ